MTIRRKLKYIFACGLTAFLAFSLVPILPAQAASATLSITPNTGTFVVDSTFDISIYLDTQQQAVNTIELNIKFPADKLQLVSSSTGKSIIGIWTSLPKFNNQNGTVYLVGGIPGGITVSRGLIASFTFRVRAVGSAIVKFENSRVLLNDGFGTEIVTQNYNSLFDLTLPPPAGPIVISDTHPDQTRWYKDRSLSLKWGDEGGDQGFSYMLNSNPIDTPDTISEGSKHAVVYPNLGDGRHYFHIRALRDGVWGGTTHFAVSIDATPPAEFKIDIVPSARTTKKQPVIQFSTSDAASGFDHFELKIIALNKLDGKTDDSLFIEAQSPYVPGDLELGDYDVIVRGFDKAGNFREQTERMEIVTAVFRFVTGKGIEVRSWFVLSWWMIWIALAIILLILLLITRRLHLWHRIIDHKRENKVLPSNLQTQMDELRRYREKYGKMLPMIALLALGLFFGMSPSVKAQEGILPPPVISTVSKNISDDEIFYMGGQTDVANAEVVIYLQNLETAATMTESAKADKNGQWFYRHSSFLSSGNYLLWTQTKLGDQMSPPSPQISLKVETTAIKFGANRLSYTTLYLILMTLFAVLAILLLIYVIWKFFHGRHKHQMFLKEVAEAEESIKRGFAILNRDIQAELAVVKQARLNQKLSAQEHEKEEQLMKDLENIEQYLSKEIWDIEEAERVGKIG